MNLEFFLPNSTILTPNRRLSAALHVQYAQHQHAPCWQSADILPYSSWLQRLWTDYTTHTLTTHPLLLTTTQQDALWETVLQDNAALLQPSETAQLAKKAWDILRRWRVDLAHPDLQLTAEGRALHRWAREFTQQCQAKNRLDPTSLADQLAEKITQGKITLPNNLVLYGFTEITPQQHYLLDCIQQRGTAIHIDNHFMPKKSYKMSLPDAETELRAMAAWAKSIYDHAGEQVRIGCVVPALADTRETVRRIFSEAFSAENTLTADVTLLPFNISAGRPLADWPIIEAALHFIELTPTPLSLQKITFLLRSPFLAAAEKEHAARAQIIERLRADNVNMLTLPSIYLHHSPRLTQCLEQFYAHVFTSDQLFLPSTLAQYFSAQLHRLGWPGERSLNSEEYQLAQRWLELLAQFATLDTVLPALSLQAGIHHLRTLAKHTVFQPRTPDAPVQISGLLEAAGMPFTHLWVSGVDDSQWPFPARPNPLIPLFLQKKAHMPHATAERELAYCTLLFKQLQQSADTVIFSHALQKEDEVLREAVFLKDLPVMPVAPEDAKPIKVDSVNEISAITTLETYFDHTAPPIDLTIPLRGGSNILRQQAACPFRAFALFRLNANKSPAPALGLRPPERGNITHRALELFWRETKDSTALHLLDTRAEQTLLKNCIATALAEYANPDLYGSRYLVLEAQRLNTLLTAWLALEKTRPDFTVIACEQKMTTTLGKIPLKLRIDRIDQTAEGEWLIIDYKTGRYQNRQAWLGERPDEPQLPLYCLLEEVNHTSVAALAFACVHPNNISFVGLSADDMHIEGIKPSHSLAEPISWAHQLRQWQNTLTKLADDFYAGHASVDPKQAGITCANCDLDLLCRIKEKDYGC